MVRIHFHSNNNESSFSGFSVSFQNSKYELIVFCPSIDIHYYSIELFYIYLLQFLFFTCALLQLAIKSRRL